MRIEYFALTFCILSAIYAFRSEKSIVNPATTFCTLWGVVFLFSSLQFYTMTKPMDSTYAVFLGGVIAFVSGYWVYNIFFSNVVIQFGNKKISTIGGYEPRYQWLYSLIFVSCIYLIFNLFAVIRNVGSFSLGNIQSMLQSGEFVALNSKLLNVLFLLIIQPVSYAIPAITAADFWYGNRNRKLFIYTIIMIVLRMLSTANRTSFLLFFIYLIIGGVEKIISRRSHKKKMLEEKQQVKKYKKWIKHAVVVAVLAFVIMTMSRGARIFRNLYLNFAMPIRMFEIWKEQVDSSGLMGIGMGSLNGFVNIFYYLLRNIFGIQMPQNIQSIYNMIMATDTEWQWVGKNILANAYVSLFWSFYLDFREVGVFIGSFLYGMFSSRRYGLLKRFPSVRNFAVYAIIFYGVLFSFVRFQFALSGYALGLLYVPFLIKKVKDKS